MGAQQFTQIGHGKTAKEAFQVAREQALYDYGHAGYTGSLAEKDSFVEIAVPAGKFANEYVDELMRNDDPRIDDKWGPAGCVKLHDDKWVFFGWASS